MTDPDESIAALIPPEPASSTSSYIVLRLEQGNDQWLDVAQITARDSKHAIRQAVEQLAADDRSGTYVAIPARSWTPVTVTARVETIVKLEGL